MIGISFMAEWLIFLYFQSGIKIEENIWIKSFETMLTWNYLRNP